MVKKGRLPIPNAKLSLLVGHNYITICISSEVELLPNSFTFISSFTPYNEQQSTCKH